MGEKTGITWCDMTFNPWVGCTKVSPGCAHCYAKAYDDRFSPESHWGKGAPRRRTSAANWKQPLKWNRDVARMQQSQATYTTPVRPRVFCASLADWLDDEVPIEWLADLLDLIRQTPNLDWLLLTKRPENWRVRIGQAARHVRESGGDMRMLCAWGHGEAPSNVWIGTTVEDQQRADERIPNLIRIPARVRFLSCEPLLERVQLSPRWIGGKLSFEEEPWNYVQWVITGGESGSGARWAEHEWFSSLRDQCQQANIAFFMKQLGGPIDARSDITKFPLDLQIQQFPTP